jgi:hypothetical protein
MPRPINEKIANPAQLLACCTHLHWLVYRQSALYDSTAANDCTRERREEQTSIHKLL